MTEEESRSLVSQRFNVSRETLARLEGFVEYLRAEAQHQNLVSASTVDAIWSRHILDSAQLLDHAPPAPGRWIDLGSGPGFPGLIVAAISGWAVTLVESRRKRVEFLKSAAALLAPAVPVTIVDRDVTKVPDGTYGVISARAFAPLPRLLDLAHRFAAPSTRWILPKGRNAETELAEVRGSWQGSFRVAQSLTDPDSAIIIADHIERRRAG